jgi:hypothetical protein
MVIKWLVQESFPSLLWNGLVALCFLCLKGHGNEADFLGFLQKSVPHESLTLPFVPFRIWLRIRKDIHNRKTTL